MTNETSIQLEPGCYVSGGWGVYGIEQLRDLAVELVEGYGDSDSERDDSAIIDHYLNGDDETTITLTTGETVDHETCGDIVLSQGGIFDELTEALPTDELFYWFWQDGELFYGFSGEDEDWTFDEDGMQATHTETGRVVQF